MASPETIGTVACENCGAVAYVKKNRGGLPYYRCGNCDHEGREHSNKGARIFLQKVTLPQPETPPEPVEKSEEKPAAPAAVPAKAAPKKQPSSMVATLLNF